MNFAPSVVAVCLTSPSLRYWPLGSKCHAEDFRAVKVLCMYSV